jgi:Tol biopolymer transport system component
MVALVADSRQVVVGGPDDLIVLSVDGSSERNLTRSPGFLDDDPSWSPRGTRIVFTSTPRFRRTRTIHTITPDGRRHRSLALGSQPSWSADGRNIVFIRSRGDKSDIFVMTAGGRNRTLLTNTDAPELEPSFAPR